MCESEVFREAEERWFLVRKDRSFRPGPQADDVTIPYASRPRLPASISRRVGAPTKGGRKAMPRLGDDSERSSKCVRRRWSCTSFEDVVPKSVGDMYRCVGVFLINFTILDEPCRQ